MVKCFEKDIELLAELLTYLAYLNSCIETFNYICADILHFEVDFMEHDSHIFFKILTVSNVKPSVLIKTPSISIRNFGFRSKY